MIVARKLLDGERAGEFGEWTTVSRRPGDGIGRMFIAQRLKRIEGRDDAARDRRSRRCEYPRRQTQANAYLTVADAMPRDESGQTTWRVALRPTNDTPHADMGHLTPFG